MKRITFKESIGSVDVLVDGDVQPFTKQLCTIRSLQPGETCCLAFEYDPTELDGKRPVAIAVFAPPAYARINGTDAESMALHCSCRNTQEEGNLPTLDVRITNDTCKLVDPEYMVLVRLRRVRSIIAAHNFVPADPIFI